MVFVSDGGGLRLAALRPVVGADKVLRYLAGSVAKAGGTFTSEPTTVNGSPALVLRVDGAIDGVLAFSVENARVTRLCCVRNPEKLTESSPRPFSPPADRRSRKGAHRRSARHVRIPSRRCAPI
ncbi:hypothetical protein AB0D38_19295 [Streptomyces sp. NPDC048279]|uniref:hypothetical protein n=1 Tax=Streptomyces sp. NPDC048279 TaxID=3154714 RepID=UPI00341D57FC